MKNILLCSLLIFISYMSGCSSGNLIQKYEEKPVLLFFGDSLISGPGLKEDERFSAVVQKKIDQEGLLWRTVNAGVRGNNLDDGLKRIEETLDTYHPHIVFLCLGANDYLQGGYKDVAVLEKKLNTLVNLIKARGHKIVLAGVSVPLTKEIWDNFAYAGSLMNTWIKGTDEFIKLVPKIGAQHKLLFTESILDPIPTRDLQGSVKAVAFQAGKKIGVADLFQAIAQGLAAGYAHSSVYNGLNTTYNNLAQKVDFNNIGLREFYDESYFLDEVHPNAKGHLLIGEKIFSILKPLLN